MPPDDHIFWVLRMYLVRDPYSLWGWEWYEDIVLRDFQRNGSPVVWYENDGSPSNPSGTQIWFNYCENDDYENLVAVWVYLRPPWYYRGVNPMAGNTRAGYVDDC